MKISEEQILLLHISIQSLIENQINKDTAEEPQISREALVSSAK